MRRTVRILILGVAALAVVVLFVLPGRQLLAQSHQLSSTRHQIDVLGRQDADLAQQAASLQTNARVEQLARQRYGLVLPGEQAYVVLPPPAAGGTTTTTPVTSNTP